MYLMRYKVNAAVIMLPWMICSVVLVLYAIMVFIKRLAIRSVDDHTKCKPVGKGLLILTAIFSAMVAALVLTIRLSGSSRLANKTLKRAAEFLGVSTYTYQGSMAVIYACMAILSIRAIGHAFSRIHLTRLYGAVLLMNVMTLLLGVVFGTFNEMDMLLALIPVLGLLGVFFATDRNDPHHLMGKRWLPVSRTIILPR